MAATPPSGQLPPQEVEAKFRISDPTQLERLRSEPLLADRYPLGEPRRVTHIDTYFDTKDWRLLRSGRTLRTRAVGDTVYVTAKSVGVNASKGMHARDEVELLTPEIGSAAMRLGVAQLPPEVAATMADLLAPDEELRALARLEQARTMRLLYLTANEETPLAELSIDEVIVLRPSAEGWEPANQFFELEIELVHADERTALQEVVSVTRSLPGVAADNQNKLQQALTALANGPLFEDIPAEHLLHVAELCRRVWKQQLAQMVIFEAGVRFSKDIEFVHEMRVATRRARAAARLYAAFFEGKNKRIKRFERDLRTTGRLLGRVRDMDVALDKLGRYAAEHDGEDDKGFRELRRHWKQTREKAHKSLVDWLDSPGYAMFVKDLGRFCETPGEAVAPFHPVAGVPPIPHQVRHVIPSKILERYEAIRTFEMLFERAEANEIETQVVPVETLHALRIECKYLRYHLEFNSVLLGPEGKQIISTLKALQEELGELNDASVSIQMLEKARKRRKGTIVNRYDALQKQTVEALRTSLPVQLQAFLSAEMRLTLSQALARI